MRKASLNADYVRTEISRWQARSMVMSTRGIVAAENPLAAQAGAVVVAVGGHAVDAAIAANAVMGVVAPMMNGIGGDLFAIVHDVSTGNVQGLNASGWSPEGATIEFLSSRGMTMMPQTGIHSVTVPGAVSGWMALHEKFGHESLDSILSAAIMHADEGFPVSEITALEWLGSVPALQADPNAAALYLPGGRSPAAGEIFRNPELADMLRHVGDPRFAKVPVEAILSKAYARQRAALIDPRRAAENVDAGPLPTHGGDTTYLCVVDAVGNIVSFIQSNFANFGSGVVPDGAGFALQSRGGLFSFDRSHPNALQPRKRPLQTVIPGFMKRDHLSAGFGVMGGLNQPQAHVQVIANIVDHG